MVQVSKGNINGNVIEKARILLEDVGFNVTKKELDEAINNYKNHKYGECILKIHMACLGRGHEVFRNASGPSQTHQEHPGRHRIQGSSMSHRTGSVELPCLRHQVVAGGTARLVHNQDAVRGCPHRLAASSLVGVLVDQVGASAPGCW